MTHQQQVDLSFKIAAFFSAFIVAWFLPFEHIMLMVPVILFAFLAGFYHGASIIGNATCDVMLDQMERRVEEIERRMEGKAR